MIWPMSMKMAEKIAMLRNPNQSAWQFLRLMSGQYPFLKLKLEDEKILPQRDQFIMLSDIVTQFDEETQT